MKILMIVGIVLAGGAIGFGWAKLVGCADGACPLTATPWRGLAFGLLFGLVIALNAVPWSGAASVNRAPSPGTDAIVHPASATAFADLVRAGTGKTVLVDFYADWCGPCRRFGPELAKFADAHRDTVTVVKINVDNHPDIASKYDVTSIPAVCLFRDGKLARQTVGAMSSEEVAAWVQKAE